MTAAELLEIVALAVCWVVWCWITVVILLVLTRGDRA